MYFQSYVREAVFLIIKSVAQLAMAFLKLSHIAAANFHLFEMHLYRRQFLDLVYRPADYSEKRFGAA